MRPRAERAPADWTVRSLGEVQVQILCQVIGHKRSKRRARVWRESWQSECIVCSERLGRIAPRKWLPIQAVRAVFDERHMQSASLRD